MTSTEIVQRTDYLLASVYAILSLSAVVVIVRKASYKKTTVGFLYVLQIFLHAIVRFIFFLIPDKVWHSLVRVEYGVGYMVFIDLVPELLFVGVYLMMVVSWGCVWMKSKGFFALASNKTIIMYLILMTLLFVISAVISFISVKRHAPYETANDWEAIYICCLSTLAVISAIILGLGVHAALKGRTVVDLSRNILMKRLTVLIVLSCISFTLKGAWAMVLDEYVRERWSGGELSDEGFAVLWFLYYFMSEVLPEAFSLYFQYINKIEKNAHMVNSRSQYTRLSNDS